MIQAATGKQLNPQTSADSGCIVMNVTTAGLCRLFKTGMPLITNALPLTVLLLQHQKRNCSHWYQFRRYDCICGGYKEELREFTWHYK
ncbi:MAG: hypothetical protein ACLRX7_09560 [Acutalibacteraceae bacterium]